MSIIAEPVNRVFRRAKTAAKSNGAGELELRELEQKRSATDDFYRAAITFLAGHEKCIEEARGELTQATNDRDLSRFRQAAEKLFLLRAQLEFARIESGNLSSVHRAGVAWGQFLSENKDAPNVPLAVCTERLQKAEARAADVLREEKARLPEWDSESLSHSPHIRSANREVERLAAMKRQIESASPMTESVWHSCVGQLLSG